MTYTNLSSGYLTLNGSSSVWYTGSAHPTVNVDGSSFDKKSPTACFICPHNIIPNFKSVSNTNTVLHLPNNSSSTSPTSGYRVYTLYCQKVMNTSQTSKIVNQVKSHIFINFDFYK